ncbi:hypothetical protein ACXHQJ_22160 [Vibrio vulnificus]
MAFSDEFDCDERLASKRKALITVSMILLSLEFTGATIKEANTFIFKIEFSNQHGLLYLLVVAVLYLLVRYHNYAMPYHQRLYKLWTNRMLEDTDVFYKDHEDEGVYGLLQGALLPVWDDGHQQPSGLGYTASGLLGRHLTYSVMVEGRHGDEMQFRKIDLRNWTKDWNRMDFVKLIWVEFKYQVDGFVRHREHLDLIGPYLIGMLALMSTVPWQSWVSLFT